MRTEIDEQIVFDRLFVKQNGIWSLLLASGYLKVEKTEYDDALGIRYYTLSLTNREVKGMFDTDKRPSKKEPERFYHGFVLGLMVSLRGRYVLTSNRESGFDRYDVMLEPLSAKDDGIIIEFKVFQPRKEKELTDTVMAALSQIEDRKYEKALTEKGIPRERIRKYGFAFRGKEVLIGSGSGTFQV